MSNTLEALQAEVLRLSPADRARLLDRLIASLDVDSEAEAAWDDLADKREQELETGAVRSVPLDVAIARLEARFPGGRSRFTRAPNKTSKKLRRSTSERVRLF